MNYEEYQRFNYHTKGWSKIPKRPFVPNMVRGQDIIDAYNRLKSAYNMKKENKMINITETEMVVDIKKIRNAESRIKELELLNAGLNKTHMVLVKQNQEDAADGLDIYNKNITLTEELNQLKRKTFSPKNSTVDRYLKHACENAVKTFGPTLQTYVATEEMGELIQALSKDLRGQGNLDNICEEIADVTIMLEQLKQVYAISSDTFQSTLLAKLNKLDNKMVDYKNEQDENQ